MIVLKPIRLSLIVAAIAFATPLWAQGQAVAPAAAEVGAPLSAAERGELLRQAQAAVAAIDDVDALMRLIPPAFFKLFDKAAFEQQTRATMTKLKALGFRVVKADFDQPTTPYRPGQDIVCFVPSTFVIEVGRRLFKTRGYLLAVRPIAGTEWKFLDGAGLDEHHEWMWVMFPELPRDIQFPAFKQEEIKS
jgi:hypothetical protein